MPVMHQLLPYMDRIPKIERGWHACRFRLVFTGSKREDATMSGGTDPAAPLPAAAAVVVVEGEDAPWAAHKSASEATWFKRQGLLLA